MRAPPPVEYTSALGRAWRAALSLLVGASVAVPLAWGLPYFAAHWGSRQPDALLEALADPLVQAALALWIGAMARRRLLAGRQRATPRVSARSAGTARTGCSPATPAAADQRGDAALMLDLGPWMLVRFLPYAVVGGGFGAATWLPLTVAGDLARWAALRGALWNWRADRGDARP